MKLESLIQLSGLIGFSVAIAFAALWLVARLLARPQAGLTVNLPDKVAFLFEGDVLINATPQAMQMMPSDDADYDWLNFLSATSLRFPDLQSKISTLPERGNISVQSQNGASSLMATWNDGVVRIEIQGGDPGADSVKLAPAHLQAMESELETLRATAEFAPYLVWRQDAAGTITWANNTYLNLAGTKPDGSDNRSWPPAALFELQASSQPGGSQRVMTQIVGEAEPRWFDCFETPLGDQSLFTAVSADKVVSAEIALRDFVQTLTKTFAHLTVGLAIFDKQRRLALFNPALSDLTSLSAGFLSGRPTFQVVLDQLRDKQMIPEPKDYKSWRRRLYELEVAAANGTYEETWSLANGQTFRVTGRPHPDGAVAFLFEDISAEISLTRRFRAELKTGQAVLDTLDQAVAVFSPSGTLTLSNAAYGKLWGIDPTTILGNFGIVDATRSWAEKCAPSPVWGDVREFIGTPGERASWSADVQMIAGRSLCCNFTPISGGATLAEFTISERLPADLPANRRLVLETGIEAVSV